MLPIRTMREPKVPKRTSALFPWMVGLIVFVLLLWVISGLVDADELQDVREQPLQTSAWILSSPLG